jgi:hypothetical protein
MLINEATGDTCSNRNPSPDWGDAGSLFDNPVFSGDTAIDSVRWRPGHIYAENLATGTYKVCLKRTGDSAITARLCIAVGRDLLSGALSNYYELESSGPALPNASWIAGRILMPQRVFITEQP